MKINIIKLGCRTNEAEIQEWKEILKKNNNIISKNKKKAKLIIINTCAVTNEAERKTRKIINKLIKNKKKTRIIITGCYQNNIKEKKKNIIIIKNEKKKKIKNLIKIIKTEKKIKKEKKTEKKFIKIQDGCNNKCSYCIIPKLRKKEKSLNYKNIIKKIKRYKINKNSELIITGINLSNYNYKKINLFKIIKIILKKTKIQKLSLSSVDPWKLPKNFYLLWKNKKLINHLHISVQNGSNKILKLMKRKYNINNYKIIFKRLKNNIKNFNITTDIIIGFFKEYKKEWKETKNLIKDLKIFNIHIFNYSLKKGTIAQNFNKLIEERTKKKRYNELKKIIEELILYNKKKINNTLLNNKYKKKNL